MQTRGKINNRRRAAQLRDFSGLRFDNITPTDIDLYLDFQDRLHVFVEFKFGDAQIMRGQELALERLVNGMNCESRTAIAMIAQHNHPPHEDIDAANTIVTRLYNGNGWLKPKKIDITLRQAIELMLKRAGFSHESPAPALSTGAPSGGN